MPLFEYQCRDCGKGFEAFVTAERQPACPGCGGSSLARLLSSPGMVGASVRRHDSGPPAGGCGMGGDSCACRARASN